MTPVLTPIPAIDDFLDPMGMKVTIAQTFDDGPKPVSTKREFDVQVNVLHLALVKRSQAGHSPSLSLAEA
jgi:hypothetical protein